MPFKRTRKQQIDDAVQTALLAERIRNARRESSKAAMAAEQSRANAAGKVRDEMLEDQELDHIKGEESD